MIQDLLRLLKIRAPLCIRAPCMYKPASALVLVFNQSNFCFLHFFATASG